MHESLDEFKFWPNTTTNSRVICPCTSEKLIYNVVNTQAPTFSIGSSSFLQVTRKTNKSVQSLNFGQMGPRDAELRPLINARNWFLFNILRMDGQNLTKFCKHIIIDKIYVAAVKRHFSQICNGVTALDGCQKLFFAQYLENGWTEFDQILYTLYHWQDLCLYCKGSFFYKFATKLQPLIDVRNCFFSQYLENGWQNLTKFCIHIIMDKV